ncbi:MBL fold metallo-hydrolase [Peterkaempfera bronchialis]|uniref:hypothetical protein n=1 Tax=Peterkaempfera bronchialis TaxID=2126346 RepID=UPI002AFF8E4E|nr:hypothetical protein [Peterkaempfera bronchialis]
MLAAGHTPGSAVVSLESKGESAVFAGDLLHSPLQVSHPEMDSCFCEDPAAARAGRERLLQQEPTAVRSSCRPTSAPRAPPVSAVTVTASPSPGGPPSPAARLHDPTAHQPRRQRHPVKDQDHEPSHPSRRHRDAHRDRPDLCVRAHCGDRPGPVGPLRHQHGRAVAGPPGDPGPLRPRRGPDAGEHRPRRARCRRPHLCRQPPGRPGRRGRPYPHPGNPARPCGRRRREQPGAALPPHDRPGPHTRRHPVRPLRRRQLRAHRPVEDPRRRQCPAGRTPTRRRPPERPRPLRRPQQRLRRRQRSRRRLPHRPLQRHGHHLGEGADAPADSAAHTPGTAPTNSAPLWWGCVECRAHPHHRPTQVTVMRATELVAVANRAVARVTTR